MKNIKILYTQSAYNQRDIPYNETTNTINTNGDVILKNVVKAEVHMERNATWYVEIEFAKSDLDNTIPVGMIPTGYDMHPNGTVILPEAIVICTLPKQGEQMFRIVHYTENVLAGTITIYATHVFFDAQKEVITYDKRAVLKDWGTAVGVLNTIVSESDTKHPYKVFGESSAGGEYAEGYTLTEGQIVYIRSAKNTNYVLAVTNDSAKSNVVVQKLTRDDKQKWTVTKSSQGFYSFVNVYSGYALCADLFVENANVTQNNLNTENEFFQFIAMGNITNGYVIYSNSQWNGGNWVLTVYKDSPAQNRTVRVNRLNQLVNAKKGQLWKFSDADTISTAYWQKYNLIQCMFGTEDNTLCNRWTDCDTEYFTAMFDNYHCYFGDAESYPENLQQRKYYFNTDNKVEEYIRKNSVENVVTGIVPQSYNGHMLPNNEIVKYSGFYDGYYNIHRIVFREYSDIKLYEDVAGQDEIDGSVYRTLTQLQNALRVRANLELQAQNISNNEITTTIKVSQLVNDMTKEDDLKQIKLNDILVINREEYKIKSMVFDLITEKASSFDIK